MSEVEKIRADVTRNDTLRFEGMNPYQELTRAVLRVAEQLAIANDLTFRQLVQAQADRVRAESVTAPASAPANERSARGDAILILRHADVSACRYCSADIAWLESQKPGSGGKRYPVNVRSDQLGNPTTRRNDFHNCRRRGDAKT